MRPIAAAAVAVFLSGCTAAGVSPAAFSAVASSRTVRNDGASGKIKHVVIIVQENRSFNDLFYGFPGARTVKYGYDSYGKKIELAPIGLETTWDIDHSSTSFFQACDGMGSFPGTDCRMNGFNLEFVSCGQGGPSCPNPDPQYGYVPHSETEPYFAMAQRYVLSDEMFASNFDASSFISHQYIIAGQAESAVNFPISNWGCASGPGDNINMVTQQRRIKGREDACWDPTTLGDELDDAGVSWAYYTSKTFGDGNIWSAYQSIKHIYDGPDWKQDVITPQTQFFDDVSNGKLRAVSWITPTCENSDHAGCGSNTGPSWVASLVNAIGQSPYWKSTAIFIFWDDYGGWYDSQPPALVDYDGLGMRIPMLIVSPYARKGRVSHVHYEHGSILRFVEDVFGLPRLSASDARAASPAKDCFDFHRAPRKFEVIPAALHKEYFMHRPLDARVPDAE